jgi:hypothetical protein
MAKFIPNDEVKYEIPKPVFDIFPKINLEAKSTSSVFSEEIQKAEIQFRFFCSKVNIDEIVYDLENSSL